MMEIKVDMKFKCNKCNELISHDYTQEDLLNNPSLDLTCQKCDSVNKIQTSTLIEKAKKQAIEEIKKNFKTG